MIAYSLMLKPVEVLESSDGEFYLLEARLVLYADYLLGRFMADYLVKNHSGWLQNKELVWQHDKNFVVIRKRYLARPDELKEVTRNLRKELLELKDKAMELLEEPDDVFFKLGFDEGI